MMHLCSFVTVADVKYRYLGRIYRWDFSEQFGPLFLRLCDGEPKQIQPINPHCWSWQAFEEWYAKYRAHSGLKDD